MLFVLVVFLALNTGAQSMPPPQAIALTGEVLAAPTKSPIAGAVVGAGATRAVTDQSGRFVLSVPAGTIRLSIAATGYVTQQVDVTVNAAQQAVTIVLEPIPRVREEVTVAARLDAGTTTPAAVALVPGEVFAVPGALDNVFRVLQTFPGVSATDEFGSRLAVRGGGPDQNLTVMDGLEIHNPYRLFGITSAFNPETIDRFELTAGGFSPKHGDRLSSLLVIDNREGRKDRRIAGSTSLAITDANVVVEGKLPSTTTGTWLLTARRTYYDLIADRLADTKLPQFADVQTKMAWDLHPRHRISLLGLRSRETTDASFEGSPVSATLSIKNSSANDLAAISVASAFGARATGRTVLGWYRHADTLSADGMGRNEASRSNTPDDEVAFLRAAFLFNRRLAVRDVSLRHDLGIQASRRQLVELGFEVHDLRTSWDWDIVGTRNPNEANGSSIQGGSTLPSVLSSARTVTRAGIWAVDRVEVTPRLRVEPGVRIDRSGFAQDTTISPRLSAELRLSDQLRFRGAVGRFTQSPGYEKMLQGDYFVDLTASEASALSSERATHAVAGLEQRWGPSTSVRFEAYWKRYAGLVLGRLENDVERARRLAFYAFPPELASSVPTAPQITTTPANLGDGRAYGFDVFVARKDGSRRNRLTGWASYTWGRATMDAYGQHYPFDYDRRHAVSAVGMYRWRSRMDVAATWRIASGFPYTPVKDLIVAGQFTAQRRNTAPRVEPARDEFGQLVWTISYGDASNLNSARLPVFARLDVRVTFHSASRAGRWELYVEVLNTLNRKNTGELTPVLTYNPSGDRPRLDYLSENVLPRLPTVGVRIRF